MSTKPKLSPKADLIMETLVARVRLGEPFWPFEKRHAKAIQELSDIGYVSSDTGILGSIRVWLEDAGRDAWMVGDYDPKRYLREDLERERAHTARLGEQLAAAERTSRAKDAYIAQLEGAVGRSGRRTTAATSRRSRAARAHRVRVRRTSQG